jgi:tellurite resistance protein TerC
MQTPWSRIAGGLYYCLRAVEGQKRLSNTILWTAFLIGIVLMLALDLGILNRKAHQASLREAALWSVVWVSLAIVFAVGVFLHRGTEAGMQFATGYLIELSLSVDNVFLFAVIFTYFQVPQRYQHRVLFWGIIGAIIMRGIMISAGTVLVRQFHWIIYFFGVLVILSGIKLFLHRNKTVDISESALIGWMKTRLRFTDQYHGQKFMTRVDGLLHATPLFLVLVMIEFTDLMFALDSIPAIFAVTRDPFIVFTSNIFAILGLRSFYFLLAGVMELFEYLPVGLSVVLIFVGFKMLGVVNISIGLSLGVIVVILGAAVAASILKNRRKRKASKAQG